MGSREIAAAVAIVVALTACSAQAPGPAVTAALAATARTTSTPIDKLEAYSFCRALLTSRLGYDRSLSDGVDSFDADSVTAADDTFEVELHGPAPSGDGTTLCVITGALGDPRLLYAGDPSAWPTRRQATLAATPTRVIDVQTRGDQATPLDSLLAWATCRVLRLAQEPTDYIAGWTDYNATDLRKGRQGIEVYELFPAASDQGTPVDTSSFCVVDGTLAAPYPVVYVEKGPDEQDARDYYNDVLADQARTRQVRRLVG